MSAIQLESSESIYDMIRQKTSELESIETQVKQCSEEVYNSRLAYYQSGYRYATDRGSPVAGDAIKQKIANDRHVAKNLEKKIAAKQARDLAEKRLTQLSQRAQSLQEELRSLRSQFEKSVALEATLER
jgi:hypothetical protein